MALSRPIVVYTHCYSTYVDNPDFYRLSILSGRQGHRGHASSPRDIANFGWSIAGSTITPTVSTAKVAPQALLDVVSCSCTAEGKACSGTRCSCNNAGLSCTDYCKCDGGVGCFSRFTIRQMNIEDDDVSLSASYDDDEGP